MASGHKDPASSRTGLWAQRLSADARFNCSRSADASLSVKNPPTLGTLAASTERRPALPSPVQDSRKDRKGTEDREGRKGRRIGRVYRKGRKDFEGREGRDGREGREDRNRNQAAVAALMHIYP